MSIRRLNKTGLLTIGILLCVLSFSTVFSCKKDSATRGKKTVTGYQETDYQPTDTDTSEIVSGDVETVRYQYHWLDSEGIPPVAIVIDDFGQISGSLLQGFMELDEEITFAVLPDLPQTSFSAKQANIHGHEVILHIPMQASDKSQNPGKTYIKAGQDKDEIRDIMNGFLEQVPQAIGANNHMGSGATADYDVMLSVMKVIDKNRMFFLDSKTTPNSKAVNAAREYNVDFAARDIFLDVPDVSPATLNQKLKELEKFRGRVEPIIIISHCHNQAKLDAMRTFTAQLKGMGIKLIPLSDAVNKFKLPG
jgi:uncharacterized protein